MMNVVFNCGTNTEHYKIANNKSDDDDDDVLTTEV